MDTLFALDSYEDDIPTAADCWINDFGKSSKPLPEFASKFVSAYWCFKDKGLLTKDSVLKLLSILNPSDMLVGTVDVRTDISYIGLKSLEQAETPWHKHVQSRQLADIEFLRQLKGNYLHNFEGKMIWRA